MSGMLALNLNEVVVSEQREFERGGRLAQRGELLKILRRNSRTDERIFPPFLSSFFKLFEVSEMNRADSSLSRLKAGGGGFNVGGGELN